MKQVLAIDLGASNGCLLLVTLDRGNISQKEVHRFPNEIIVEKGHSYWDIDMIFNEIKKGLKKVTGKLYGIGVDTWGVDVGFIGEDGQILERPFSYRDPHTIKVMESVHKQQIDKQKLFERTGVESAAINTLYQLKAVYSKKLPWIERINTILTFPSVINYLLTGEKKNEFTHASTTQMLDVVSKQWDSNLLKKIFNFMPPLAALHETSTILGNTKEEVNQEIGMDSVSVIQVPGHDTACAIAAIPYMNRESAFMSCGTWVLLGVEVDQPVVTKEAFEWGFTNEGTAEGTFRLQKNNMGLWLLQQCKREWETENEGITYKQEAAYVTESESFRSFIDPDDPLFFNPSSMIKAIQQFCEQTNQPIPVTKGQIIRCILESIAMQYRWVINCIEFLTGKSIPVIHMVGGGIQNENLCQFTANATRKEVQAGPIEASSLGNALSQFIALGAIENWQEAKKIVAESYGVKKYESHNTIKWDIGYEQFKAILSDKNNV